MTQETLDFIVANLGNWALIVIVVAISIVAIKVVINFDLNKHLESRKRRRISLAQNICPHMDIELSKADKDNLNIEIKYQPWFESPPMTTQWTCRRCKFIVNNVDNKQLEKMARYYINNPKAYTKAMRKSDKHIMKAL